MYNLNLYGSTVLQGISPHWIAVWFINHGTNGWRMLGGVMLCITGTEALFADLGHFSIPSIRVRLGVRVPAELNVRYRYMAVSSKYHTVLSLSFV